MRCVLALAFTLTLTLALTLALALVPLEVIAADGDFHMYLLQWSDPLHAARREVHHGTDQPAGLCMQVDAWGKLYCTWSWYGELV